MITAIPEPDMGLLVAALAGVGLLVQQRFAELQWKDLWRFVMGGE